MQPMEPCVATVGFFDGVHVGHQHLIRQVIEEARTSGMASAVITFDRHPRQTVNTEYIPQTLSTPDTKLLLLSKTHIDNAIILPFDKDMALMTAHNFMKEILKERLNVHKLVIGYDNRFGKNRTDDFGNYAEYGHGMGIEVIKGREYTINGLNVSSSAIRRLLEAGDVETAGIFLGYPYTISGIVVDGYKKGRLLGFPTANIDPASVVQMIPAYGVYSASVRIEHTMAEYPAMINIGTRPTFNGHHISLETNIFNFGDNIYGKKISVAFRHRLRDEKKFNNMQELAEQLCKDRKAAEQQFEKENEL